MTALSIHGRRETICTQYQSMRGSPPHPEYVWNMVWLCVFVNSVLKATSFFHKNSGQICKKLQFPCKIVWRLKLSIGTCRRIELEVIPSISYCQGKAGNSTNLRLQYYIIHTFDSSIKLAAVGQLLTLSLHVSLSNHLSQSCQQENSWSRHHVNKTQKLF